MSVDAPQQTQDTSSSTTLLTRVTRIFQKSVFTEATPAARTGHPAGRFAARAHAAAVPGVFSRVERRRRRDDIRVRQRIRHGTIAMQASVAETAGHCFRPVIYNENTYHSVWRRKRPPRSRRFHAGRCDRPMIIWGIRLPGPLRLAICSLDPSLRRSQLSTSRRRRCGRRSDCAHSLPAGRSSRWARVRAMPTAW